MKVDITGIKDLDNIIYDYVGDSKCFMICDECKIILPFMIPGCNKCRECQFKRCLDCKKPLPLDRPDWKTHCIKCYKKKNGTTV